MAAPRAKSESRSTMPLHSHVESMSMTKDGLCIRHAVRMLCALRIVLQLRKAQGEWGLTRLCRALVPAPRTGVLMHEALSNIASKCVVFVSRKSIQNNAQEYTDWQSSE